MLIKGRKKKKYTFDTNNGRGDYRSYVCFNGKHEMRLNGDLDGTDLCHHVRSWWESKEAFSIYSSNDEAVTSKNRLESLVDFKR